MKSTILTTSAAALLVIGAASTQACAAGQWDHRAPYSYDRRDVRERVAFDNGERDGYAKGIDDLRHHRLADVRRQKWYRNGDHEYNGRYGPKEEYRIEYRHGFEQGYDRAFREWYREGWRR
jgi:hypothetical protein